VNKRKIEKGGARERERRAGRERRGEERQKEGGGRIQYPV